MTGTEEGTKRIPKAGKAPLSLRIFQLVLWLSVLGLIGFYSLRGAVLAPPAPSAAKPAASGQLLPVTPPDTPFRRLNEQSIAITEADGLDGFISCLDICRTSLRHSALVLLVDAKGAFADRTNAHASTEPGFATLRRLAADATG